MRRRPARVAAEKLNSKKKELNFFGVPFAARAGPGRRRRKIKFKKKELNFLRASCAAQAVPGHHRKIEFQKKRILFFRRPIWYSGLSAGRLFLRVFFGPKNLIWGHPGREKKLEKLFPRKKSYFQKKILSSKKKEFNFWPGF